MKECLLPKFGLTKTNDPHDDAADDDGDDDECVIEATRHVIRQNYATYKRKTTNSCWPDDLRPVFLYWNGDRRSTATRLPK